MQDGMTWPRWAVTNLIKSYLDIADLSNSAKMLALANEIVELNIKLNANVFRSSILLKMTLNSTKIFYYLYLINSARDIQ